MIISTIHSGVRKGLFLYPESLPRGQHDANRGHGIRRWRDGKDQKDQIDSDAPEEPCVFFGGSVSEFVIFQQNGMIRRLTSFHQNITKITVWTATIGDLRLGVRRGPAFASRFGGQAGGRPQHGMSGCAERRSMVALRFTV